MILFFNCNLSKQNFKTPNIILINIDDMGWNDVSFMGSEYYQTPNIDALAAQGMIFTQGYARMILSLAVGVFSRG